jgi:hypothetical protein
MSIRRQNPDSIHLINESITDYLKMSDLLKTFKMGSDEWFATLRQHRATYQLLKTATGLSETKLDDLIYNKTNTASYWLPDGTIRKEHP